jgi:hypothetical protein
LNDPFGSVDKMTLRDAAFYDGAMEYLPLARAAALAHDRLFPGQRVKEAKTLDLLALALSSSIALYQQDGDSAPPRRVSQEVIAAGRFTRGATRLEVPGRPPLRFLVVARRDLEDGLEAVATDQLLTTLTRPRPPASSSAPGA